MAASDLTLGTKFTAVGATDVVSAIDAIRKAVDGLSKSSAKIAKVAKTFTDFSKAEAKATQATKKFTQETDNATKKTGKFGEALNKLKGDLNGVINAGKGIAGIGKSMVDLASFPIKEAADFQQGMQNVKAVMFDVTEEGFAKMGAEARKMGETTAATAKQAAEALQFLAMAGLDADEATTALAGTLQLAQAGNISMAQAADISTNVLAGLGLEVEDLGRVVDVMAVAASKSNQSVTELGRAMKIAGPAAKGTATSMEDMVAILGGLADNGIKGAQAGHGVKRMLLSLLNPTSKAATQLKEMGISLKDSSGKFKGLAPVLAELQKGWDGNANALAEADKIFGKFTATTAVAAAGAVGATAKFDGMKKALNEASGAGKKMSETRLDSFWGEITLLQSKISSLMIDAGLPLLDMLKSWAKWFRVAVDGIQTAMKYFGNMSPVIVGVVGVLSGLLVTVGSAITAFGTLAIAITAVSTVMKTDAAVAMIAYARNMSIVTKTVWLFQASLGKIKVAMIAADAFMLTHSATWQTLRIAITATAAAAVLAYAAIGAGLIAIAYHGWKWYEASEAARKSQERLIGMSNVLIGKFKEFGQTDFSKIDITKLTQEGVKKLQTDLQKAKVYWIAMKNIAETKNDSEAIALATNKLKELQGVLQTVNAQDTLTKPKEAIRASIEEMGAFKDAAVKAYEKAGEAAKKYAEEVIAWEEKMKFAKLSTEDKIRELGRKGLDEYSQWTDKKKEAEEKLAAAKKALAEGDFELADKLTKSAEGLYASLAVEIKKQSEAGKASGDTTIKSIKDTKGIAIAGIKETGDLTQQILKAQKDISQENLNSAKATSHVLKTQIESITKDMTAGVKIELQGLEEMSTNLEKYIEANKDNMKVHIPLSPDSEYFYQAIQDWKTEVATKEIAKIPITVGADFTKIINDMKDLTSEEVEKQMGENIPKVPIGADMQKLHDKLAELKTTKWILDDEKNWIEVPVNADDEQIKKDIAELTKTETKIIKIVKKTTEEKSGGGFAGEFSNTLKLAMGKILPGYGGGDTIDAKLERGEAVIPKKRVRQFGRGFIQSLIDGTLAQRHPVVKLAQGAIVDNRPARSSSGDGLISVKDFGTFKVPVGNKTFSVMSTKSIFSQMEQELKRAALAGAM